MSMESKCGGSMKSRLKKIFDKVIEALFAVCLVAVTWLAVELFCITSFSIPSDSMEPVLKAGDNIWVEKLSYGTRLFNVTEALKGNRVEVKRLPGLGKVKRGDVVVFHNPCPHEWMKLEMDLMKYYVKRCAALPGDTFYIENGIYKVKGYDKPIGDVERQQEFSQTIDREGYDGNHPLMRVYPDSRFTGWSPQTFGPFHIPQCGDSIPMDERNVLLYRNVIEWEQRKDLVWQDEEALLGGEAITGYRFKGNYYFMVGDKVENSRDSRYWGLVPEEFIVGKVWKIWKSVDKYTDEIRWERFGKSVE